MNIDHFARALLATEADAILAVDCDGSIDSGIRAPAHFWFCRRRRNRPIARYDHPGNTSSSLQRGIERVMASGETRYGSGDLLSVPAMTKKVRRIFGRVHHRNSARRQRRNGWHGGDHARRNGAV